MNGEPTVGYYQFKFNGEDAVPCHGVGHHMSLVPAVSYDEKYKNWDLYVFEMLPKCRRMTSFILPMRICDIMNLLFLKRKSLIFSKVLDKSIFT